MPPLNLYARVLFLCSFAHETAGAARTQYSLRPLVGGQGHFWHSPDASRRRGAERAAAAGAIAPALASKSNTQLTLHRMVLGAVREIAVIVKTQRGLSIDPQVAARLNQRAIARQRHAADRKWRSQTLE